ncbi:MAG: hypothetical protein WC989_03630 [Micavibrio sp.]
MKSSFKLIMGVAALALLSAPAVAETKAVSKKTSVVNMDGSVDYESSTVVTGDTPAGLPVVATTGASSTTVSKTTVTRAPVKPGAVTFYYYDPEVGEIVAGNDLTDDIISLWDLDNNHVIDNHEFYSNAMVVYEPLEYSKRTYQDIDGKMKLTKEEYTLRLQQLPHYRNLNKDGKDGLTLYEFTGVGFQEADYNNDNQVSFEELKEAFYAKEGVIPKPLKMN